MFHFNSFIVHSLSSLPLSSTVLLLLMPLLLLLLSCKCAEHNLRDGTSIQGLSNNSIVFAIFVFLRYLIFMRIHFIHVSRIFFFSCAVSIAFFCCCVHFCLFRSLAYNMCNATKVLYGHRCFTMANLTKLSII